MMQLPRGTFRELKKAIRLESLLQGLKKESFSGYCKIFSGEVSAVLVLEHGAIILASSAESRGDAAVAAIGRWEVAEVDAVLHSLNTLELQISREFNPSAQVKGTFELTSYSRPVHVQTARASVEPATSVERRRTEPIRLADGMKGSSRSAERTNLKEPDQDGNTPSLLLQELEALDMMEMETIAKKFRENCRQMIEKLELEHLLDSRQKKESP
jgi:hypothetical protein